MICNILTIQDVMMGTTCSHCDSILFILLANDLAVTMICSC